MAVRIAARTSSTISSRHAQQSGARGEVPEGLDDEPAAESTVAEASWPDLDEAVSCCGASLGASSKMPAYSEAPRNAWFAADMVRHSKGPYG